MPTMRFFISSAAKGKLEQGFVGRFQAWLTFSPRSLFICFSSLSGPLCNRSPMRWWHLIFANRLTYVPLRGNCLLLGLLPTQIQGASPPFKSRLARIAQSPEACGQEYRDGLARPGRPRDIRGGAVWLPVCMSREPALLPPCVLPWASSTPPFLHRREESSNTLALSTLITFFLCFLHKDSKVL